MFARQDIDSIASFEKRKTILIDSFMELIWSLINFIFTLKYTRLIHLVSLFPHTKL